MGLRSKFRAYRRYRREMVAQQKEILSRQQDIQTILEAQTGLIDRQSGQTNLRRAPIYVGDRTLLAQTVFGRKIYLDATDISLTPHIAFEGQWEPGLTNFWKKNLQQGMTFVDIGANCGYFSVLAAHLVGTEGTVVALEPQKHLAKLIYKSLFVNGYDRFAICLNTAIGETETTALLEKSDSLSGSASIPGIGHQKDTVEEVTVKPLTKALQEASEKLGKPVLPNAMKIDCEGYEWLIWLGATDVFAKCDKLIICLEFSPLRYHDMGDSPIGFLERIQSDGFKISLLQDDGSEKLLTSDEIAEVARVKHGHDDLILRKGY